MRSADCLADLVDAARSDRMIPADVTNGFLTTPQACLGKGEIEAVDAWDNFEFAAIQLDIQGLDIRANDPVQKQVQVGWRLQPRPHG